MEVNHSELYKLREEVRASSKRLNLEKITLLSVVEEKIAQMMTGYGDSKLTSITFSDLSLLKVGDRNEVAEGVYFEKTYDDGDKIVCFAYLEKGCSFGIHYHDCVESIKVLKGNLLERERGYKVYSEGEMLIYAVNEAHRPYATEDSLYEVILYRDLFK